MKIVVWTGAAWEDWSPDTIRNRGMGGSEIAACQVSRALVRRGHEVWVVGRVLPGVHEGVTYVRAPRASDVGAALQLEEHDVFVSSRDLEVVRLLSPRARLKIFWSHDAYPGCDPLRDLGSYDVVFALSSWARSHLLASYDHLRDDQVFVTRNGIDPSLFLRGGEDLLNPDPVDKERRVIYASSPDRGLSRLLRLWPEIREGDPDLVLDVYYGFENLMAQATASGDRQLEASARYLLHRVSNTEGVCYHGRVGQAELAWAYMRSVAWLYPTSFSETSCISAMEAQAASCLPITSLVGALPETAWWGVFSTSSDGTDQSYDDDFVALAREAVRPDNLQRSERMYSARKWSLANLSWSRVAESWERLFEVRLREKTT